MGWGFANNVGLPSIAAQLAPSDLFRTLALARSLQNEEARAFMTIEACRAVLASNPKKPESEKPAKKEPGKEATKKSPE
ncbi:MAG: hypothetical protein ACREDR_33745, partial [Blastocatellia bacterium]